MAKKIVKGNFERVQVTDEENIQNVQSVLSGFKAALVNVASGSMRSAAALVSKLGMGTMSNSATEALGFAAFYGVPALRARLFQAIHIIKEKSFLKPMKDYDAESFEKINGIVNELANVKQQSNEQVTNTRLKRYFVGRILAAVKKGKKLFKKLEETNKPMLDEAIKIAKVFTETVDTKNPVDATVKLGRSINNSPFRKELIELITDYSFVCYINNDNPDARREIYTISKKKDFVFSWHKSSILKQLKKFILGKETAVFNLQDGTQFKLIIGFEDGARRVAKNYLEFVDNNDENYLSPEVVKHVLGFGDLADRTLFKISNASGIEDKDVHVANNNEELKKIFAYGYTNRRSSNGEKIGVIAQHLMNLTWAINKKSDSALKSYLKKNLFVVTTKQVEDTAVQEELDTILSASFNKLPIVEFNGQPCVLVKKYEKMILLLNIKGEDVASLAAKYSTLMAPFTIEAVADVFTTVLKEGIFNYEQIVTYDITGKPEVSFSIGNLIDAARPIKFKARTSDASIFRCGVSMTLGTMADGLGALVVPNLDPKSWGIDFKYFRFNDSIKEIKVIALGRDCKTILKGILKVVVDPTVSTPVVLINEHIVKGVVRLDQQFTFYTLDIPKSVRIEENVVSERGLLNFLTDELIEYLIESGVLQIRNGQAKIHMAVIYGMTFHILDGSADNEEAVYMNENMLERVTMNGKFSKTKCGINGQPFHGNLGFTKIIVDNSVADGHIYVSPKLAERLFRDFDGDIVYLIPLLSTDKLNIDEISINDLYEYFGMDNISVWRDRYDSIDDMIAELQEIVKIQNRLSAEENVAANDATTDTEEKDFFDAIYGD